MTGIIIVGVDGNSTSMKAARVAAHLAKSLGSTLRVVTAFGEDKTEKVEIGNDEWFLSTADEAERVAQRVADELKTIGVKTEYSSALGKPAEVLIEEATRAKADLIVVGNIRMQGLKRVLGSVANAVSHNAPCDVYIVKTDG
ncbi:universal stress protein [Arthrobacter cryoconiti]|uniref:Universal stress protein n=1 Tax=Arthrobacter cryoconiti TaxID=748907 RepID=A0ABV8R5A2_9MICC|nr:universal stress protein [Arthrobacter cryoconiti]MCC9067921.1 universal stress protein [Arthrobacter cryoconiti]